MSDILNEMDQSFKRQCLLEEWKALAQADSSDDSWAIQKENILLPVALTSLGFATDFCLSGKPFLLVLFAGAAGFLLLVVNFMAIEGINNHQFARRQRMREIEGEIPLEFYSRQDELRSVITKNIQEQAAKAHQLWSRLFLHSSALSMRVRLRRLRFMMALGGGLYFLVLLVMLCVRK